MPVASSINLPLSIRDGSGNITTVLTSADVTVMRAGFVLKTGAGFTGTVSFETDMPGGVRVGSQGYLYVSGVMDTSRTWTVTGITYDDPGRHFEVACTSIGSGTITAAAGDRFVLVPTEAEGRANLYKDAARATVLPNPTQSGSSSGLAEFYTDTPVVDLYIEKGGVVDAGWMFGVSSGLYDHLVTPEHFGALGGASDDTTPVQNAAHYVGGSLGGGTVYLSQQYRTTGDVELNYVKTTVQAMVNGAGITPDSTSGLLAIEVNANDCRAQDVTFIGKAASELASPTEAIRVTTSNTGFVAEGCTFTGDSASTGFNNHIRFQDGCDNFMVTDCVFERVVGTSSGYGYGIIAENSDGGVIADNRGVQTGTQGRHHVYLPAGTSRCAVDGNTFTGGTSSQIVIFSDDSAGQPEAVANSISDNVCANASSSAANGAAIEIVDKTNATTIEGNTIFNAGKVGIKIEADGLGSDAPNTNVSGNTIVNCGREGILVLGADNCNVNGNTIINPNVDVVASTGGIEVTSTGSSLADECSIEGNVILGSNHDYAIRVDVTTTNGSCSGNTAKDGTAGGIRVDSTTMRVGPNNTDAATETFSKGLTLGGDLDLDGNGITMGGGEINTEGGDIDLNGGVVKQFLLSTGSIAAAATISVTADDRLIEITGNAAAITTVNVGGVAPVGGEVVNCVFTDAAPAGFTHTASPTAGQIFSYTLANFVPAQGQLVVLVAKDFGGTVSWRLR